MARIDYVDPKDAKGRTNEFLEKLGNKNIFRMLGHSEKHFEYYIRLGGAIRYRGTLDAKLWEIAITRTGILCDAEYEVVAHKRLAREAGVSDKKIAALEQGASSDVFSELEKQVLRFTDGVVTKNRASDETFNPLAEKLGKADMVELVIAIGFYVFTSKFLMNFDIDLQK